MAEMIWIEHPNLTEEHKTEVPLSSLWLYERSGWVAGSPPEEKPLGVPTTLPEKATDDKGATSKEVAPTGNEDTSKKTVTSSTRKATEAKGESK